MDMGNLPPEDAGDLAEHWRKFPGGRPPDFSLITTSNPVGVITKSPDGLLCDTWALRQQMAAKFGGNPSRIPLFCEPPSAYVGGDGAVPGSVEAREAHAEALKQYEARKAFERQVCKELDSHIRDTFGDIPDNFILVRGTGSSELIDTDGDVFEKSALEALRSKSANLNSLLNHDPRTPESLFGGVWDYPTLGFKSHEGKEYGTLELAIDVQTDNPRALQTHDYIIGKNCRPRQFGFSVGALYEKYVPNGIGVNVKDLMPVEWSVVTMPANRLAWIETVTKDLIRKGVLPPRRLAIKGWDDPEVTYRFINKSDYPYPDYTKLTRLEAWFEATYGIKFVRKVSP